MASLDRAFSYYELSVRKRADSGWEWEVTSPSGRLLMHGLHPSRAAARYYGYRSLLLLLGTPPRAAIVNGQCAAPAKSPSSRH